MSSTLSICVCVCVCVFVSSLLFSLLRGDTSLIPGDLLRAMTGDASRSNNIQGGRIFTTSPSLLVLKPLGTLHPLIFIHIASSVFFGCTSSEIHHGRKKKVFSLRRISPYSQHCWKCPLWSDFSQRQNVFQGFFKHTHTSRGTQEQSTYNTGSLGNRL